MLNMKQTTSNQSSSVSVAPPQPVSVSILRRSPTVGSNRKNNLSTTAASFNQSAHSSGEGDGNNSHLLDTNSNSNNNNYNNHTPITGADVLVGRILEFQRPFPSLLPAASAAADNDDDDGKGMQRPGAAIRAGQPPPRQQQRRRPPPPPPPRSGSLKKNLGKAMNPSATNSPTSSSETTSCTTNSCYENEKEQEHVVRRLAIMKLDGRDSSTPRDSKVSDPPPPPPPPRGRGGHLNDRGERQRRSRARARSSDRDDDLHSSFHSSNSNFEEEPPTRLRRSKSVEEQQQQQQQQQQKRHLNDRQRRSRGHGGDRDNDLHASFSSSNSSSRERPANAHVYPPPPLRQHHRSRSREVRRFPDKEKSISSDTEVRRKKNLGSNLFVRQDGELNFDTKTGRCKKHPSIILAKKSKFRAGSWEVIKKNGCPFCAKVLEEDCDRDGCEQSLDEDTKRKMDMLLRCDQDNSGNSSSSHWSRNGETRKASSSRGAAPSGNSASLDQNVIDSIPSEGLRGNKVQRMLYTTPMGETGWYTGEVDLERKPHGHGRMRYKTGHSYEGEWIHGYGEVHMENLNRMKAGFGTNKAAWKKSEMAPSVRKATTPDASKSSSSPSTRHHYQQQQQQQPSNNQGYLSAQMQQHAHLQQVQMQHAQMQQAQMQQQHAQMQQQQAQLHQAQMQHWANMSPQERQMVMNQWYASVGMSSQPGGYQMQGYPPVR